MTKHTHKLGIFLVAGFLSLSTIAFDESILPLVLDCSISFVTFRNNIVDPSDTYKNQQVITIQSKDDPTYLFVDEFFMSFKNSKDKTEWSITSSEIHAEKKYEYSNQSFYLTINRLNGNLFATNEADVILFEGKNFPRQHKYKRTINGTCKKGQSAF